MPRGPPRFADDIEGRILPRIAEDRGIGYRLSGLREQERNFLNDAMVGLIASLLGIYAVLAWIFASWTRPLVVMSDHSLRTRRCGLGPRDLGRAAVDVLGRRADRNVRHHHQRRHRAGRHGRRIFRTPRARPGDRRCRGRPPAPGLSDDRDDGSRAGAAALRDLDPGAVPEADRHFARLRAGFRDGAGPARRAGAHGHPTGHRATGPRPAPRPSLRAPSPRARPRRAPRWRWSFR